MKVCYCITFKYLFKNTGKIAISRQPIYLSDFDYDYILEEIDQRDKIEFEREIDVYSDDMED